MKRFILVFACVGLVVGCAALRQGKSDYDLGKNAPYEEGETSPSERAERLVGGFRDLPYVGPVVPYAIIGLTGLFTWRRGRRLRKNLPTSKNPITGNFTTEWFVQRLAEVSKGIFEVGPEGSSLKRGWKVALATGLAGLIVQLPALQPMTGDLDLITAIVMALVSGGIAALEKGLSIVLPTVKPEAQPGVV